jgi:hypothetical protein
MKKLLALLFTLGLAFSLSAPVFASATPTGQGTTTTKKAKKKKAKKAKKAKKSKGTMGTGM